MTRDEEILALVKSALAEEDANNALDFLAEARRLQPDGVLPSEYPFKVAHGDARALRAENERLMSHRLIVARRLNIKPDFWTIARDFKSGHTTVANVAKKMRAA